jgi:hypothetical protein
MKGVRKILVPCSGHHYDKTVWESVLVENQKDDVLSIRRSQYIQLAQATKASNKVEFMS